MRAPSDLGEAVLPAVGDEAGRVGVAVGVAALDGLHVRLVGRRQQPVLDLHVVLARHLVEGVGERVDLGHVEGAAGPQVPGDDAGPALEVGQPLDGAPAHEDDVEAAAAEVGVGVVEVGADELGAAGQADLVGQAPRQRDGLVAEVEADDLGAEARPAERVEAEVALQVQQGRALVHVAARAPRARAATATSRRP